jgi:DNA-binding MarR family transcriptional regulator
MGLPAFTISQIDEIIHSRVRLGVMAYLMTVDTADFSTLKTKLGTTDGTLSVHLRKLKDANYIAITKRFKDQRPLTEARLTRAGRKAFREYLNEIGKLASLE